jgi:hypothetical protein
MSDYDIALGWCHGCHRTYTGTYENAFFDMLSDDCSCEAGSSVAPLDGRPIPFEWDNELKEWRWIG